MTTPADPTAALKLARDALAYCAAAGASGQPISGDIAADALAAIDALPAPSGEPADIDAPILTKARELFGFVAGLGGFETAVRELAAHIRAERHSAQAAPVVPQGMAPTAYEIGKVEIVSRKQKDGSRLWAVVDQFGNVLNKAGEWEFEPMPSSRDDDFMTRCRFASPLEARDAYMQHLAAAPHPAQTEGRDGA